MDEITAAAERLLTERDLHLETTAYADDSLPRFEADIETVARAALKLHAAEAREARLVEELRQAARDGHIICAYGGPIERCPNAVCQRRLTLALAAAVPARQENGSDEL